jgi:hypothetical protein
VYEMQVTKYSYIVGNFLAFFESALNVRMHRPCTNLFVCRRSILILQTLTYTNPLMLHTTLIPMLRD